MGLIDELTDIAADAWNADKSDFQRQVEQLTGDSGPKPCDHYRIYDFDGTLILCHLCGEVDRWTLENEAHPVFVCEHEPIQAASVAIRQVSSRARVNVWKYELVRMEE